MGIEYSTGFCEHCNDNVKIQRKTPNHIFHFIMSILTCGIWLLVWACLSSEKDSWRCSRCGANLGGGSNGWGLAGALLSKKPKPKDVLMKKCPFCAEMIRAEARVCRFCQRELPIDVIELISPQTGNPETLSQHVPSNSGKTNKNINIKTLVISLCLLFLCFLVVLFVSKDVTKKDKDMAGIQHEKNISNIKHEDKKMQTIPDEGIIYI